MRPPILAAEIVARGRKKGPAESGGIGVGTAGRVDIQPRCAKSVPSYQMKKSPSEPGVPFRTPGLVGKNSSRAHSITRQTASWSCGIVCLCV